MLRAAEDHYRTQARFAALAVLAAGRTWDRLNPANLDEWADLVGRLTSTVAAQQLLAARDADPYLAAVLREENVRADAEGRVAAAAFVGVAGDGRPVESLLYEPLIGVKEAIGQGASVQDAMASGRSSLAVMVASAVQDAGRAAVSTGIAARPKITGYVRMLNLPSCERCVPLAGKWYRWNDGFERHPKCDCRHVPASEDVAGDLTTDPLEAIKSGQVTGLSKADTKAIIEDGADVSQVINAHRGMSTEQVFGQRLKVTSEGTTRRGLAGVRLGAGNADAVRLPGKRYHRAAAPRLRPESIYKIATDRADAIRLLKRNGYII
jgi:hypothetical protein